MGVTFLTLDDVLLIHQDQITHYGGAPLLRDAELLQSVIAMPQASFRGEYLHEFPGPMVAAYFYRIVQGHPFVDGNQRTGLVSALTFLKLNGLGLSVGRWELEEFVLSVARGKTDKQIVTAFFRGYINRCN